MTMRISPLVQAIIGAALLCANSAQAQLAQNLTIGSPKAMALGNAVTADFTGIDSVHYNPAALSKLKGRQTTVKFITGVMDIRADFDAPADYGSNFLGLNDDSVANTSSSASAAMMYLPGVGGATELPVLFAPLAGLSVNPPGSKFTRGAIRARSW
jgi:long-subunit fatty acid transport protein